MATLTEVFEEYRLELLDNAVGEDLAGAKPKTLLEVVEAAREIQEELEELLEKLGGRSEAYDRLRQALIQLDVEMSDAPSEIGKVAAR